MSDRDIALAAAHRIAGRLCSLYPNHPYRASGYAAQGQEIPPPYVGGGISTWVPTPGTWYVRADVDGEEERVYSLLQPGGAS